MSYLPVCLPVNQKKYIERERAPDCTSSFFNTLSLNQIVVNIINSMFKNHCSNFNWWPGLKVYIFFKTKQILYALDFLNYKYNIIYLYFQVPIKALQEKLYVRISAHLYNNFEEYVKLAKSVLKIAPL